MKLHLKLLRIHQWVKNIYIFIPIIFSGEFLDLAKIADLVYSFFAFSLLASSVYIVNDIIDYPSDKNHPTKKKRPIASGKISINKALVIASMLFVISISAILIHEPLLVPWFLFYALLNLLYSWRLKHIAIVDILVLALFYVIRIVIGGITPGIPLSSWLLLTFFFLSLFLGSGKRYLELVKNGNRSRKVLKQYSPDYLKYILQVTSICTILFYALYSTTKGIYIEISTVFVVTGFFNYFYSLSREELTEDPSLYLFQNKAIILCVILWGLLVMASFYL